MYQYPIFALCLEKKPSNVMKWSCILKLVYNLNKFKHL